MMTDCCLTIGVAYIAVPQFHLKKGIMGISMPKHRVKEKKEKGMYKLVFIAKTKNEFKITSIKLKEITNLFTSAYNHSVQFLVDGKVFGPQAQMSGDYTILESKNDYRETYANKKIGTKLFNKYFREAIKNLGDNTY